jgi:aquaporin Z
MTKSKGYSQNATVILEDTGASKVTDAQKYVAGLVGTFVLVFIGCGSAALAGQYIGFVGISFAFGLSVLALVYTIGSISGCHINPAVSISMLAAGKLKPKETVFYIIMQCIGATLAA